MRQPDGTIVLLIQAMRRFRLGEVEQMEPFIRARIDVEMPAQVPADDDKEAQAAFNNLRESAITLLDLSPEIPEQARLVLANIEDPGHLTDLLAGNLGLDVPHKQALLEETDVSKRMRMVQEAVSRQIEIAELQQKLRKDVESQFSGTQRRAYLREQIRAIQRELGEEEPGSEDQVEQLRQRLKDAGAPENVMETAEKELKRLIHIPSASPEYSVIVSYVEMLADLPWAKLSEDDTSLDHAQEILDRDHYGLIQDQAPAHRIPRRPQAQPDRATDRSSVSSDLPAWARRAWVSPSPTPWAGSSRASPWAASATRRKCAATGAPTSAPCRAASSRNCAASARATPS